MQTHRAWAEIDLEALSFNLSRIRALAGPKVRTMMVVKADAYGHGAVAVAHQAEKIGVEEFGVGDAKEALELRGSGILSPILVLGTIIEDEIPELLSHRIEIAVHSTTRVRSLNREASKRRMIGRIHLNVDTGMGRLGVFPEKVGEVLAEISRSKHLQLVGMMTHLASADGNRSPGTAVQMEKFRAALQTAASMGIPIPKIHCANSAALFTGMDPLFTMVRPGIAAYGIMPKRLQGDPQLKPVLSLKTQIIFLKDHPAGSPIGYNGRFVTTEPTRIATLPLGYNDGVPYRLGNRGHVLVRGKKAPIVGAISMDYTTIDIGKIPGARVGDTVTVLGRDGHNEIRAEEVAATLETIAYEITCAIGKRVRREYLYAPQRTVPAPRRPSVKAKSSHTLETPAAAPSSL